MRLNSPACLVRKSSELNVPARPDWSDAQAPNLDRPVGNGDGQISAIDVLIKQDREVHLVEAIVRNVPDEVDDVDRQPSTVDVNAVPSSKIRGRTEFGAIILCVELLSMLGPMLATPLGHT